MKVFKNVVEAVRHLHQQGIVHGDIKLANIMIDSQCQIKVIDFGYSSKVDSPRDLIQNYSGTPVYLSPEIIKRTPYNGILIRLQS
jgi:serine/threonine protein kinase